MFNFYTNKYKVSWMNKFFFYLPLFILLDMPKSYINFEFFYHSSSFWSMPCLTTPHFHYHLCLYVYCIYTWRCKYIIVLMLLLFKKYYDLHSIGWLFFDQFKCDKHFMKSIRWQREKIMVIHAAKNFYSTST